MAWLPFTVTFVRLRVPYWLLSPAPFFAVLPLTEQFVSVTVPLKSLSPPPSETAVFSLIVQPWSMAVPSTTKTPPPWPSVPVTVLELIVTLVSDSVPPQVEKAGALMWRCFR